MADLDTPIATIPLAEAVSAEDAALIVQGGATRLEPRSVLVIYLAAALAPSFGRLVAVPASATASGTAGDHSYDGSYFYICTATDTWRRVAHATW